MRGLAGFLLLALLASCAPPPTLPGPPPPLPAPEAERGIGGTGAPNGAPNGTFEAERGIGGTGIIGVITGFGSIFVDGLEVRYGTGTEVSVDDANATPAALREGQVVAVSAVGPTSALVAESISVVHEVAGPVEAVEDGGRMVRVAGQEVVIPAAIPDQVGGGLARGDWVAVSGLQRPDGAIVATRIDPSPAGLVRVRGPLAGDPFARLRSAGREGVRRIVRHCRGRAFQHGRGPERARTNGDAEAGLGGRAARAAGGRGAARRRRTLHRRARPRARHRPGRTAPSRRGGISACRSATGRRGLCGRRIPGPAGPIRARRGSTPSVVRRPGAVAGIDRAARRAARSETGGTGRRYKHGSGGRPRGKPAHDP